MTQTHDNHILAFRYSTKPELGFVEIVRKFDDAFQSCIFTKRRLTWDCEDVAIFECTNVRVALGWMAPDAPGRPWVLIVALGTSPGEGNSPIGSDTIGVLATTIRKQIETHLPFDALFRTTTDQPIDAAQIDSICEQVATATIPAEKTETPDATEPIDAMPRPRQAGRAHHPRGSDISDENIRMRKLRTLESESGGRIAGLRPLLLAMQALVRGTLHAER